MARRSNPERPTWAEVTEPVTIRPWSRTPGEHFEVDEWFLEGHVYRGMTSAEFWNTAGVGLPVKSRGDWSHPSEGTCFGDVPSIGEGYANSGQTDPRKTGEPNYLIEVSLGPEFYLDRRDDYWKTHAAIPFSRVTRVWAMYAAPPDRIVAAQIVPVRGNPAPKAHELFYIEDGKQAGPYVHVKFLPADARRARWYWAYRLKPRRIGALTVPCYSVVNKYGEKRSREDARGTIEVTELLMGEPLEERPAGLSYHYGELEEL